MHGRLVTAEAKQSAIVRQTSVVRGVALLQYLSCSMNDLKSAGGQEKPEEGRVSRVSWIRC